MDVGARFEAAKAKSAQLSIDPGNEAKLHLYGLYKQATSGDASGKQPGRFDPVGRAKFDAWSGVAGMSSDDAMTAYADYVDGLAGS